MNEKSSKRLINALQNGWGFANLEFNPNTTQRHSLWISSPEMKGMWQCNKVDASIPANEYIEALLDESGVPTIS